MKRNRKTVAAVLLVALWIGVLYLLQCLVVPKYQTGVVEGSMIEEYYRDPTRHDVVMIGDCEIYENISTVELWRQYGITSYLRGSAQQLPWQSYYLLEDTLRYETPKVVVFNVLSLKYNEPQSEAYNRMSIDGMKWSSAKVGAIQSSMTEEENFIDYVFPLLRYHSRWSELTRDDITHMFSKDLVTFNGYYMRADIRPEDEFPDPMPLADYTLGQNAMSYLRRMDALCKEKGITLVLVKAPTLYPHWYDEWDSQIADYAAENGLSYLNFIDLREKIGLDMSMDTYDAGLHLNVAGAEKLADYFGGWLRENGGLPDHRGEKAYADYYEALTKNYEKEKNAQLTELEKTGQLLSHAPVAVKETGFMKKIIVFALIAALCLGLAACSPSSGSTEASSAVSSEKAADVFTFTYHDVRIALKDEMAPIVKKLGEPKKYFESESCAFKGLDKVYTYDGVVIRTYPQDNVDYVLSVEFKDDTVATEEGVSIGDTRQKVEKAYGKTEETSARSATYAKGGVVLSVIFGEDDTVSSITYTIESQTSNN